METDNGLFRYAYDRLNRLVEAANGKNSKQYGYDNLGNRVMSLQNGLETRHSFNARNQLIRTEEGSTVIDFIYDKRGNLTKTTENGQLKAAYTFDATNKMTSAFTQGKGMVEYTYNGLMNRVKTLESLQDQAFSTLPDPCKEMRYIIDMTKPYDNLLATEGEGGIQSTLYMGQ